MYQAHLLLMSYTCNTNASFITYRLTHTVAFRPNNYFAAGRRKAVVTIMAVAPSTPPATWRSTEIEDYPITLMDPKNSDNAHRPPRAAAPRWQTEFVVGIVIGQGDFGKVYRATSLQSFARGCLKVVEANAVSANEGEMLRNLKARGDAPNCMLRILMEPWLDTDRCCCVFLELLPTSQLLPGAFTDEEEGLRVLRDLAVALTFLSNAWVVHNDVKPANAGRRADGTTVLYDYGLAHGPSEKAHALGSLAFLAPEMGCLPLSHFDRGDCYALGLTIATLIEHLPTAPTLITACAGLSHNDYALRLSAAEVLLLL